jgi:hypothetical protein
VNTTYCSTASALNATSLIVDGSFEDQAVLQNLPGYVPASAPNEVWGASWGGSNWGWSSWQAISGNGAWTGGSIARTEDFAAGWKRAHTGNVFGIIKDTGSMSQTFTVASGGGGIGKLNWYDANRASWREHDWFGRDNTYSVTLTDDLGVVQQLGTYTSKVAGGTNYSTPPGGYGWWTTQGKNFWFARASNDFTLVAGRTYTLSFNSLTTNDDRTTFLDDITIISRAENTVPVGYVTNCSDCNDASVAVNPGATEVCNGIDDDCDGFIDNADPSVTGQATWYADVDGDGFGYGPSTGLSCTAPNPGDVTNNTDDCPAVVGVIGSACDDGNVNTTGDVLDANCVCAGQLIDCLGVAGGSALPGTACNDNNAATGNDVYDANCVCAGTLLATDCLGVPGGPDQPGTPCNDGLATTGNDTWSANCVCAGQLIDCLGVPGGTTLPGSACDDNNAATDNDVYGANCVCAGQPILEVDATVLLDGPYDDATDLMRDDLRADNLIPSAQPYTNAPFSYSGTETVSPAVLSVTGDNAIVDWVLVELRSSSNPATILHKRAAFVQRDGDVVGTDGVEPVRFPGVADGSYYVAIRHRNHFGAMTATALSLQASSSNAVDFTTAPTWGTDAQKMRDGRSMLWACNARVDALLRYTGISNDRDPMLTALGGISPTASLSNVYRVEDTGMDGDVKYTGVNNDRELLLINVNWGLVGTSVTRQRLQQLP